MITTTKSKSSIAKLPKPHPNPLSHIDRHCVAHLGIARSVWSRVNGRGRSLRSASIVRQVRLSAERREMIVRMNRLLRGVESSHGIVHPSGNPWRRSHSVGVRRRTIFSLCR